MLQKSIFGGKDMETIFQILQVFGYAIGAYYMFVLTHELGHHIILRKYNVPIDEFAIGRGKKRLIGITIKGTWYGIKKNLFNGGANVLKNEEDLKRLTKGQKLLLYRSGIIMNYFVLAVIVVIFYMSGGWEQQITAFKNVTLTNLNYVDGVAYASSIRFTIIAFIVGLLCQIIEPFTGTDIKRIREIKELQ